MHISTALSGWPVLSEQAPWLSKQAMLMSIFSISRCAPNCVPCSSSAPSSIPRHSVYCVFALSYRPACIRHRRPHDGDSRRGGGEGEHRE